MLIRVTEKCSGSVQVGCLISLYGDEVSRESYFCLRDRNETEGLASFFSRLTSHEISENIKKISIFYLGTGFH